MVAKRLILVSAIVFSSSAYSDAVENEAELSLLPPFCWGTQQVRQISKDPTPIEKYMAIYGEAYRHLHHYCWALNSENKALRISDNGLRKSKLEWAMSDFKYFLDRAPIEFPLLPEIYANKARFLFALKRNAEAISALEKSIQLKPDYSAAYLRLSDHYQTVGDSQNAIKTLEQGIVHTNNPKSAARFITKLEKLGKPFQGTVGSALPKVDAPALGKKTSENEGASSDAKNVFSTTPVQPPDSNVTETPTPEFPDKTKAMDQQPSDNPYCRFCP